ncbi:dimethylallyl transferase [Microdochium bolleyi]|uniref:Dimethylallyl transferase n=1 Tax=Microdochium bolleyi TaxID=196109 RepID=A0A136IJ87_9PEZI|nr:dimethylallyl transferase [Microdochium bolleyi]
MTDDHTPAELSWSWSGDDRLPAVRYSVEPIGWDAGSDIDPHNVHASAVLLGSTLPYTPSLDLHWYRHFLQCLTLCQKKSLQNGASDGLPPSTCKPPSQTFIAFDLEHNGDMVVKYYFLPSLKAASLGTGRLELTEAALSGLRLREPSDSASVLDSFHLLTEYIATFPSGTVTVEIVAVDCVTPSKSRVKIYVRSRQTTFGSVLDMLTLGGRAAPLPESAVSSLKELWVNLFATAGNEAEILEAPLPENPHCTAGILYYFELKPGLPLPTSKVYLPVRHYAQDDEQIALGLSRYLEKRGKGLAGGMTYLDGVRKLW